VSAALAEGNRQRVVEGQSPGPDRGYLVQLSGYPVAIGMPATRTVCRSEVVARAEVPPRVLSLWPCEASGRGAS